MSKRLAERLADDPAAAAAVIQPTSLHLVGGTDAEAGVLVMPYGEHGTLQAGGTPCNRGPLESSHLPEGEHHIWDPRLLSYMESYDVASARGLGRKPDASLYTRKLISLTGGWAKAWCSGASLYTQKRLPLSLSDVVSTIHPAQAAGCAELVPAHREADG